MDLLSVRFEVFATHDVDLFSKALIETRLSQKWCFEDGSCRHQVLFKKKREQIYPFYKQYNYLHGSYSHQSS